MSLMAGLFFCIFSLARWKGNLTNDLIMALAHEVEEKNREDEVKRKTVDVIPQKTVIPGP